jgi:NADPH:quinone reductase-like Zn-dependent oxidoreductase
MHAMELQEGFGFANLREVDRPALEPGPGEVLIEVAAASINRRDVGIVAGAARNAALYQPPFTPLSDAAGRVIQSGPGALGWSLGDRVVARFFPHWIDGPPRPELLEGVMGGGGQGAAQTHLIFPAHAVSASPSTLTDIEACTLPCAALTAWRALMVECEVRAGETVLVQGTGTVSLFALQFAKAAGARVIITSSSDEKLEKARGIGADLTVNYVRKLEWAAEARRLAGDPGIDHVIDVGGAATLRQSMAAVRFGGTIVLVGRLSGSEASVAVPQIFANNLRLIGVTVGNRVQFEAMVAAIERHDIRPVIDSVVPLAELPKALSKAADGEQFGKSVLTLTRPTTHL